jgi:hypothetical protein
VSGITAVNKEQLTGSEATISCTVSGLTEQLTAVKWTKSDGATVTSGQDGITIDPGSHSGSSQTTTLTVTGPNNNQDTTYNCIVTSKEPDFPYRSKVVNLKVFSKYH